MRLLSEIYILALGWGCLIWIMHKKETYYGFDRIVYYSNAYNFKDAF